MTYVFEALADVRLTTENIQKVIRMYPRDNDWKKLITKYRRDIDALRRGKDLPKKVEDELMQWALDNGEIKSDDVDELDDFIDGIINEGTVNENPERTPAVKAARKAHKAGTWDGNVDKEGNPIVHLKGKPYTVVMEALKKSGKGIVDVDYIGDSNLTKKLERKFKVKIKQTGRTTADISGDYKNIINFLKSDAFLMDNDEIEDTFPELAEAVEEINEGLPNQKQLEKDVMAFMKNGRSDGITGLRGISKSLEQKYKVGPAAARSAVKKLFSDIVDGTYKEETIDENYNQDLTLATKNIARLSNKETGQDKKDYQAVSRALAQGNLGAAKKVIKSISTKEIQSDLLNILVGYNALIAKMYPKATDGKGNLKAPMSVDKMIKEDEG